MFKVSARLLPWLHWPKFRKQYDQSGGYYEPVDKITHNHIYYIGLCFFEIKIHWRYAREEIGSSFYIK